MSRMWTTLSASTALTTAMKQTVWGTHISSLEDIAFLFEGRKAKTWGGHGRPYGASPEQGSGTLTSEINCLIVLFRSSWLLELGVESSFLVPTTGWADGSGYNTAPCSTLPSTPSLLYLSPPPLPLYPTRAYTLLWRWIICGCLHGH